MRKPGKVIKAIVFVAGLQAFMCCKEPATVIMPPADAAALHDAAVYNDHIVDSAVAMVRSGYIVVRTGLGADSYLLSQMNLVDKTYSHCGIVMMEHGYPFVYHCIGGEDNPDAVMRRDSAHLFFSPLHNFGFGIVSYDYADDRIMELRKVVRRYYEEKRMFDMKFDIRTDDRLYCAEMIYKAVNAATGDSLYIKPSSAFGYRYVGIDDLYLNKHARQVWQVKFK